jgi:hypothetical protein
VKAVESSSSKVSAAKKSELELVSGRKNSSNPKSRQPAKNTADCGLSSTTISQVSIDASEKQSVQDVFSISIPRKKAF